MIDTATEPKQSAVHSKGSTSGARIRQLLRLGQALIRAGTLATEPATVGEESLPLGVDLAMLTEHECAQWAQDLEQLGSFHQAMSVQVANELKQRSDAGRFASLGARHPANLMVQKLKISIAEARRRLRLAEAVFPQRDNVTGLSSAPAHPLLAQAFFEGHLSQEQALMAADFMDQTRRLENNARISERCCQEVELTIRNAALEHGPDSLRRLGNRLLSHLDPDGQQPSHADLIAKQGIFFRQPRHGLVSIGGSVTVEQYEQLMALIGPFTNPNKHGSASGSSEDEDSRSSSNIDFRAAESTGRESVEVPRIVDGIRIPAPGSTEELDGLDPSDPRSSDRVVKDDRSYAQKLLDGLLECLKLAGRADKLPINGGLRAQLIITTRQEDLDRRDGTGTAFTSFSGPMPLSLFDQSLCDPKIMRITMGEGQEILNAGRSTRLFTGPQRSILLARDLGCCFPDCTAPPLWCEAHHVLPWQLGGESNVDNGALLCGIHHSLIHHSDWTMELLHGVPFFLAPYFIDPSQTPRRNTYHHGLLSGSSASHGSFGVSGFSSRP